MERMRYTYLRVGFIYALVSFLSNAYYIFLQALSDLDMTGESRTSLAKCGTGFLKQYLLGILSLVGGVGSSKHFII